MHWWYKLRLLSKCQGGLSILFERNNIHHNEKMHSKQRLDKKTDDQVMEQFSKRKVIVINASYLLMLLDYLKFFLCFFLTFLKHTVHFLNNQSNFIYRSMFILFLTVTSRLASENDLKQPILENIIILENFPLCKYSCCNTSKICLLGITTGKTKIIICIFWLLCGKLPASEEQTMEIPASYASHDRNKRAN